MTPENFTEKLDSAAAKLAASVIGAIEKQLDDQPWTEETKPLKPKLRASVLTSVSLHLLRAAHDDLPF